MPKPKKPRPVSKLVRDKIPELMRRDGARFTVRRLEGKELRDALMKKILEEAHELAAAHASGNLLDILEERGDMLEALKAYDRMMRIDARQASQVRREKARRKGPFRKGILLTTTGS